MPIDFLKLINDLKLGLGAKEYIKPFMMIAKNRENSELMSQVKRQVLPNMREQVKYRNSNCFLLKHSFRVSKCGDPVSAIVELPHLISLAIEYGRVPSFIDSGNPKKEELQLSGDMEVNGIKYECKFKKSFKYNDIFSLFKTYSKFPETKIFIIVESEDSFKRVDEYFKKIEDESKSSGNEISVEQLRNKFKIEPFSKRFGDLVIDQTILEYDRIERLERTNTINKPPTSGASGSINNYLNSKLSSAKIDYRSKIDKSVILPVKSFLEVLKKRFKLMTIKEVKEFVISSVCDIILYFSDFF